MSKSSTDANKAKESGSGGREGGQSKSLVRGVQLLRCFTPEEPLLGISELGNRLNESRSTIHRYATTLVSLGYLEQNPSRKYQLRAAAADVGIAVIATMPIYQQAEPLLRELRLQTGYTAGLGVLDREEVLYLASIHGSRQDQHAIDHDMSMGSRAPLHATAAGKAILVALPDTEQDTVIAQMKLTKRARNTIASKKALRDALAKIAKEGPAVEDEQSTPAAQRARIAVDDAESSADIQAIAAPIIADEGEVLGAIELRAPRSACTVEELRAAHGAALLDTARRLSVGLDFVHAAAG